MMKFKFLTALLLLSDFVNAQSFIIDYNKKTTLYKWDGTYIYDYESGKTLCKIEGDFILDYQTKRTLYKTDGTFVEDYQNGGTLFKWDYEIYFNNYRSGKSLFKIDGIYINDYNTGNALYKIEGEVPRIVLTYVLAVKGLEMIEPFGKATGTFEAGSLVAAKSANGDYYYSCIKSKNGDNYEIQDYLEKNSRLVTKNDLMAIPPQGTRFQEGDKVFAVWPKNGIFYDGVLGKTEEKGAMVKWDDGSAELFVTYDRMIKK